MLAWLVVAVAAAMGMSATVMTAMAAHLYTTAAAAEVTAVVVATAAMAHARRFARAGPECFPHFVGPYTTLRATCRSL